MKDCRGLARQWLAELDPTAGLDHAGKDLPTLLERHVAQIMAIEEQQVEGDEIEVMLATHDRLSQFAEVGKASVVRNDDLAVDHGIFRAEALRLLHQVARCSYGRCGCRCVPRLRR